MNNMVYVIHRENWCLTRDCKELRAFIVSGIHADRMETESAQCPQFCLALADLHDGYNFVIPLCHLHPLPALAQY